MFQNFYNADTGTDIIFSSKEKIKSQFDGIRRASLFKLRNAIKKKSRREDGLSDIFSPKKRAASVESDLQPSTMDNMGPPARLKRRAWNASLECTSADAFRDYVAVDLPSNSCWGLLLLASTLVVILLKYYDY